MYTADYLKSMFQDGMVVSSVEFAALIETIFRNSAIDELMSIVSTQRSAIDELMRRFEQLEQRVTQLEQR